MAGSRKLFTILGSSNHALESRETLKEETGITIVSDGRLKDRGN